MTAKVRKHAAALVSLAIYNFILFFPVAFLGRVLSPNDVFFNYEPWLSSAPVDVQNGLINDPPTSYLTLMSLVKDDWRAFHWNPYIGSGIPGFGSSASAVLSPFILLPVLLVPLTWVYTAIVFLKLNVAYWLAYQWLRQERLGKLGAAIGALVIAGAGIYAVRWLWQLTNATALYPALLWLVRRAFDGKRNSIALMTLVAVAYALSGFPSTMAYGAYLAGAYALFLMIRHRRFPALSLGEGIAAVALALLIAAPSLVPFAQFVRRTGYLTTRANAALQNVYPPQHWRSFLDPERLGNPAYKNWLGDRTLGIANNYVESTIYVGIVVLPLLLFALLNRRARARWFWLVMAIGIVLCMFGIGPIAAYVAKVPGFKYSSLLRVSLLLPIAVGYLAAAGAGWLLRFRRWRTVVACAIGAAVSWDLAVLAGRFYPYLEPKHATIPSSPILTYLRQQPGPFRIAPFFDYLWPNTAELFRLEDIRSHFSSEAEYRRLLQRLDPTAWGGASTVIQFNSIKFDVHDPLVGMLGVRYFVEQRNIDILRWRVYERTSPGVKETGALILKPGQLAQRTITVGDEPFYAIELPVSVEGPPRPDARFVVSLLNLGFVVHERAFTPDDIGVMNKVYMPLRPYARRGESVTLRVQPVGMTAGLLRGEAPAGESPLFFGRVATPIVFDRQLEDGRLFLNVGEVPRFRAARNVRRMTDEQFLATRDVDFAAEAIVTDANAPEVRGGDATVRFASYAPAEQRLDVESPSGAFVASSEKLTPELRITIDGKEARPVEIHTMFAGVQVPAGKHAVVFERRIARGWWIWALLGTIAWLAIAAFEVTAAVRRR